MNRIRIVCYGDSNTWGYCAQTGMRYDDDERWTQLLAQLLGSEFQVVEEGLCGRTAVLDDPLNEGLNGLAFLAPVLGSHSPVDLLVLMLGTNDCKERFSCNAQNVADGIKRLVLKARTCDVWRTLPRILLVAPVVMDTAVYEVPRICGEMGRESVEKSRLLPDLLRQTARETGVEYMDCNPYVALGTGDYMHFDAASQARFAKALSKKILQMLR